jgi:glycerol-3-phosphate dehydrogenase
MHQIDTDIIIIGAGIAGLWLHHRLNDLGYHAILIEKNTIGAGQTLSSQGIIHGGAKYTLNGILSNAASSIADMPQRWLDCLEGKGEIDLSHTKLLSSNQLMWSTQSLSSKLTSFFSSKALHGKIKPLQKSQHPSFFCQDAFKGNLYQIHEPVIDVPSLLANLATKWRHRMLHLEDDYTFSHDINDANKKITKSLIVKNKICINAKEFILTSGEGNEKLFDSLSITTPKMQRRPLQMVLAKGPTLPELYAHCIGASTKPIATISTHLHSDGDKVWYIGGNIAEEGVDMSPDQLIKHTIKTLTKILPWIDLENIQWATHTVNRAEPAQNNLLRPDTAFLESINNIHIGWPTKLALTPNLSDKLIQHLEKKATPFSPTTIQKSTDQQLQQLASHYSAKLSPNLWERSFNATH